MRHIAVFGAIMLVFLLVAGSVAANTENDQTKIIAITLGFHKNSVNAESVEVRYGHPPNLGHQAGNFLVTVWACNGTQLYSFNVGDPRYQFPEYGNRSYSDQQEPAEDAQSEQAYKDMGETEDIDLPFIIPYNREIQTVSLTDKTSGMLLISVDVSAAVESFRCRFPRDPDMLNTQAVVNPQGTFMVVGVILAIILIALLTCMVRKS